MRKIFVWTRSDTYWNETKMSVSNGSIPTELDQNEVWSINMFRARVIYVEHVGGGILQKNVLRKKVFIWKKFESVITNSSVRRHLLLFSSIDYAFLSFLHHGFLKLLGRNSPERLLNCSPNFCNYHKPHTMQSRCILCEMVYARFGFIPIGNTGCLYKDFLITFGTTYVRYMSAPPPENGFRERKVYHNFVCILYNFVHRVPNFVHQSLLR